MSLFKSKTLFILCLCGSFSSAQVVKTSDKLLTFGMGYSAVKFRDFATSPLFYEGGTFSFSFGYEDYWGKWYADLDMGVSTTNISMLSIPILNIKSEGRSYTTSSLAKIDIRFTMLKRIGEIERKKSKFDFYVGGGVGGAFIFRINESLFNNKVGIDLFPSLFVSTSIRHVYERTSENRWVRLFIPRQGSFIYRMDIPLVYASYRNSNYIYTSDASIRNSSDVSLYKKLNFYNGFQISSVLSHDFYLGDNKGNIIRLSYQWDMYITSKDYYPGKFEYNDHLFLCTFLFNIN